MRIPYVSLSILFLLVIADIVKSQDCAPLDPRQEVSEKITQDVIGTAKTVFKIGNVEGTYKGITEKEVKNLYDKYPEADKIVLRDKLIYLFCTTIKESGLNPERKMKELQEFQRSILDIKGEKPVQLKKPRFAEKVEHFSFSLTEKGLTTGQKIDRLRKEPYYDAYAFDEYRPFKMYVEGDEFYVDVEIYGGKNFPPISIKRNELSNKPPYWDFNYNEKALEIVDEHGIPMYQLYYKTPSHIVINGIFPLPIPSTYGAFMIADIDGHRIVRNVPTTFKLKPIFKYPAWKYPGIYADGS